MFKIPIDSDLKIQVFPYLAAIYESKSAINNAIFLGNG